MAAQHILEVAQLIGYIWGGAALMGIVIWVLAAWSALK